MFFHSLQTDLRVGLVRAFNEWKILQFSTIVSCDMVSFFACADFNRLIPKNV